MSEAIPTHLLKLKKLAEVPRSEYMDAPVLKTPASESNRMDFIKKLRRGEKDKSSANQVAATTVAYKFNAAVWLRFANAPTSPTSFWLAYRDDAGEYAVMVDEAKVSEARSTMLSGCVTLQAKGKIQYLHACCKGPGEKEFFNIEELYVQRDNSAANKTSQRIA